MAGVPLIVFVLIVVPDHHQSVGSCSGRRSTTPGSRSRFTAGFWFVFGLGLLMSQYTNTGYDASAHMSEETRRASRAAAWGMVMSVVVSVVFGFVLLVAVTFAVPDVQGTLDAGRERVTYIWHTSLEHEVGRVPARIACVAQFFCGTASVTSASRMMFAFSRDGAVPGRKDLAACVGQPGAGLRRHRDRRPVLGADDPDATGTAPSATSWAPRSP